MIIDLILIKELIYNLCLFDLVICQAVGIELLDIHLLSVLVGQCHGDKALIIRSCPGSSFRGSVVDFKLSSAFGKSLIKSSDPLIELLLSFFHDLKGVA